MNSEPDRPAEDEPADAPASDTEASAADSADVDPLAEATARADENWDRYLRAAAELENVRKRAARDIENAHKFALERFARDLLAVSDSLEMALETGDEASVETLREGNEATLKLLGSVLQRFGVEEVDPIGEPFDPAFHEAMTMQPSADAEPGSVLTVFQKGYALNGRLLRPARVVVASAPAEASKTADEG
jgi:molecular chaperone GrpE